MIKELHLKNWKSFKDSKLYIDPLTILIGTNASGKSNVLDALQFLQKISLGKQLSSAINGDKESAGIRGGSEWAITKGCSEAQITVVAQSSVHDNTDYHYSITIGMQEMGRVEIKSESLLRVKSASKSAKKVETKLFHTDNEDLANPSIISYYYTGTQGRGKRVDVRRSHSVLSQSQTIKLLHEVQQGVEEIIELLTKIFILDPIPSHMRNYSSFSDSLTSDASNISGVLAALTSPRKEEIEKILTDYLQKLPEKDISRVWTERVGRFQTDAMLYCSEKWLASSDDFEVDARGMSDGTLRFLAIMTALLTIDKKSMLVIEEIDNGFHPSRAKLLVQFLKEEGTKREIDIVFTTHNPALLDALGNEMIVFISVAYRNNEGASEIKLLENIIDLPFLISQGTIGKLAANGLIEESVRK